MITAINHLCPWMVASDASATCCSVLVSILSLVKSPSAPTLVALVAMGSGQDVSFCLPNSGPGVGFQFLDHLSSLDIDKENRHIRGSSIVCTIGPACQDVDMLVKMLRAGMNIARFNVSHGTLEWHAQAMDNVRKATAIYEKEIQVPYHPVAIALDTKGPEIRTGNLVDPNSEVALKKGNKVKLTTDEEYMNRCTSEVIYVDYKKIMNALSIGSRVFIDNGLIGLTVLSMNAKEIVCEIENDSHLGSRKGVNLADAKNDLPSLSKEDERNLQFAIDQQVDAVFVSYVKSGKCVRETKKFLNGKGCNIFVVAKIETISAVENIEDIIESADGILLSRGELGISVPPEKLFLVQKMIIAKCNSVGKSVICAAQMLDSMVTKPRPTRAETSDVANAVLDGSDCVMLSAETSKGLYPVESVETMHKICLEAESALYTDSIFAGISSNIPEPADSTITTALAAVNSANVCDAAAILVLTKTGKTAQMISMFRPKCPTITIVNDKDVARRVHFNRGLFPYLFEGDFADSRDWTRDVEERVIDAIGFGRKKGIINDGDMVVIVSGWRPGAGASNTTAVVRVG